MKIGESDARVSEQIQVGGIDLATEGADVGKPEIVRHYHQEVRPLHAEASSQVRPPNGMHWGIPPRLGLVRVRTPT